MIDALAFWTPIFVGTVIGVALISVLSWNDARVRRRRDAAFEESNRQFRRMLDETRPCPSCHGAGRVLREEPTP